ncbi:MAG: hypothetical protein ACRDOA_15170 [Streptosporangiaceae bacterium]
MDSEGIGEGRAALAAFPGLASVAGHGPQEFLSELFAHVRE